MAGVVETLTSKLGVPGRRKYDVEKTLPAFPNMTVREKLLRIALDIGLMDKQSKQRHKLVWYLMALYYSGYQNVELNESGDAIDVHEREDFYVENQFRRHCDTVIQILNNLESDVIVRPASDTPSDIATSRVADPVLSMQKDTIGYDRLRHMKNLNKVLFGTSYQFVDYVTDAKYGTVLSPKYDYEEIDDPTDESDDPVQMMTKVFTGMEKRNRGSEVGVVCSPLEVDAPNDILGGFENIPYLRWHTRHLMERLNYVYPGLNAGSTSSIEEDLASMYMENLANLPGNILGDIGSTHAGTNTALKGELVRTWIKPCMFRGDKQLEGQFPDGVQVITVNGRMADFYGEDLNDHWTQEVLIPVPASLLGDGLYDAVQIQDQINEMDSLLIRHTRYTTVGHKLYDSTVFDPKVIKNDPANGWIPGTPGMDKNIRDAAIDLGPGQLSPDVSRWMLTQKDSMADMTSAYDAVSGKSTGANSPYSQSVYLTERAQGRWANSTKYNRPALQRFNRQLLQLAKDNWIDERTRAIKENTGEWSFQKFSKADLRGNVDIILTDTDFKPKNRAEQLQALMMLQQMAPILPALPPKQKLKIEETLGLPADANPMSTQVARAYRHIDRIKQGMPISPLPFVDDAMMQIPVFQDFLASEEGDAIAEQDPQTFANVYTFMTTLMMMGMQQQAMVPGATAQPAQPGNEPGQAPEEKAKKQPGGQEGQQGGGPKGGPNSANQPPAQTPEKGAPPVEPPSPKGF
jgi:hypothetical protein